MFKQQKIFGELSDAVCPSSNSEDFVARRTVLIPEGFGPGRKIQYSLSNQQSDYIEDLRKRQTDRQTRNEVQITKS
jgi:hypothetical protein